MNNFFLIFLCMGLGYLFRGIEKFPKTTSRSLNSFVIYLSFPAVILSQLPDLIKNLDFNFDLILTVLIFWFLYILSALFFYLLGKKLKWNLKTIGALSLTAGLSNTSFVGFPLLEALLGSQAIPNAILLDQLGTFLICSTLGVITASFYSRTSEKSKINYKGIFFNILKFPPFLVLFLTGIYCLLGFKIPEVVNFSALKLSQTLIPLALFAVGFQLSIVPKVLRAKSKELAIGLSFKLVLSPIVAYLIYFLCSDVHSKLGQITVLEAAMAPMITAAVIANEFDLDGEIANLMVGLGIPLSILTVSLINFYIF